MVFTISLRYSLFVTGRSWQQLSQEARKESRLVVIDVTKGLDKVTKADVLSSADFVGGTDTANADASGNAAVNVVSEAEAEIYVLVTNQALAKFKLTLEIPSN